jgi:hypothetical protein
VARSEHRALVFGAVEVLVYTDKHGYYMERAGRLRLANAERADEISIRRFLLDNVELGTEIDTDQWKGYSRNAMRGIATSSIIPKLTPCTFIGSLAICKPGSTAPIMASMQNTCKIISMNLSFVSTAAKHPWQLSKHSWACLPNILIFL